MAIQVRLHSHYKPLVIEPTFDRLRRMCASLDEDARLWSVYGEVFRVAIDNMEETLKRRREALDKIRGAAKSGAKKDTRTIRAKQMADRHHCWATRHHVCQECGTELAWATARSASSWACWISVGWPVYQL